MIFRVGDRGGSADNVDISSQMLWTVDLHSGCAILANSILPVGGYREN